MHMLRNYGFDMIPKCWITLSGDSMYLVLLVCSWSTASKAKNCLNILIKMSLFNVRKRVISDMRPSRFPLPVVIYSSAWLEVSSKMILFFTLNSKQPANEIISVTQKAEQQFDLMNSGGGCSLLKTGPVGHILANSVILLFIRSISCITTVSAHKLYIQSLEFLSVF